MVGIHKRGFDRSRLVVFSIFASVLAPNPFKMIFKVVLELLLDVPEVLLEVLDLSRRSWGWFWRCMC